MDNKSINLSNRKPYLRHFNDDGMYLVTKRKRRKKKN